MSLKEDSEQILFNKQKWTDSGTEHNELEITFNQKIWRYDGLVEMLFLDGHSPGIKIYKIFIWADGYSGYFLHPNMYWIHQVEVDYCDK